VCDAMWLLQERTFRRNVSPASSARCVLQLLVTANIVPSSLILFTQVMEVIRSSEMCVLTRATRLHIPEDGIIHSQRRENLKSHVDIDVVDSGLCQRMLCFDP
jgi:hypothetical protein